MKYIKHIVLMAFVMVMTGNAWGMQIYIHYLNGTWPTGVSLTSGNLVLEMEPSDSFENLKAKIQDKTGFNPLGMKLSYGTYDELVDNQILNDCGISNGATINLTTIPYRTGDDNLSWAFQMSAGNRVLRTTWKQNAGLTFDEDEVDACVGFPFTSQVVNNPNNLSPVTYAISSASGNTIEATSGAVTIVAAGNDTVKAIFAGDNDNLADTAVYVIHVRDPYTLTLAKNGNGTLEMPPASYTLTFSGTDDNYNPIVVDNYDGTSFSTSTLGNNGMGVRDMLTALYGSEIDPNNFTTTEHVSVDYPWIVVTDIFNTAETITLSNNYNEHRTITVSCTSNMTGVVADANNSNKYYVIPGTEVTVTATPAANHNLESWTKQVGNAQATAIDGAPSTAAVSTTFAVTANTVVGATFAIKTYTVKVVGTPDREYGSAQITNCSYCHDGGYNQNTNVHTYTVNHGDNITIEATPTTGHHFAAWEGGITATSNPLYVVIDRDTTISAYFEVDTFAVSASGTHGTVTLGGAGLTIGGHHGKYGGIVTFTAVPDPGYRFVQWNDGKTANPLDSIIRSAVHLTATFELASPGLTPEGEITVLGNKFVDEYGQIVGSPRLTEHGELITGGGTSVVPVSSITVSPADTTFAAGKTATLTAIVLPDNATDPTYTWSSDATGVATVDQNGVVTAVAAGTAHIRAIANDGSAVYGECIVTVGNLLSVTVAANGYTNGNKKIYYVAGETWRQAIENHHTLNSGWYFFHLNNYYYPTFVDATDGATVYDNNETWPEDYVGDDAVINGNHSYKFQP